MVHCSGVSACGAVPFWVFVMPPRYDDARFEYYQTRKFPTPKGPTPKKSGTDWALGVVELGVIQAKTILRVVCRLPSPHLFRRQHHHGFRSRAPRSTRGCAKLWHGTSIRQRAVRSGSNTRRSSIGIHASTS